MRMHWGFSSMGSKIRGFNLINSPVMNQKPKNASFRLLAGLAALTLGTVEGCQTGKEPERGIFGFLIHNW